MEAEAFFKHEITLGSSWGKCLPNSLEYKEEKVQHNIANLNKSIFGFVMKLILCSDLSSGLTGRCRTSLRGQLTAANLPSPAHLCQIIITNTTNSPWGKLSITNSSRASERQSAEWWWQPGVSNNGRASWLSKWAECRVAAVGGFPFSHPLPPLPRALDHSEFGWFSSSSGWGCTEAECIPLSVLVWKWVAWPLPPVPPLLPLPNGPNSEIGGSGGIWKMKLCTLHEIQILQGRSLLIANID